jgi:hypothetical protein
MARSKKRIVKQARKNVRMPQTEATNEPRAGTRRARKTPLTQAQRKSAPKKPSEALRKSPTRAVGAAGTRPMKRARKGGLARPGVNPRPGGRGKRR